MTDEYNTRLRQAVKNLNATGRRFLIRDFNTWRKQHGLDLLAAWTKCVGAAKAGEPWPWE